MKKIIFLSCLLLALTLISCEKNEPTKGGSDTASLNQPENPKDWHPIGHKYVSTDESHDGRYLGIELVFLSYDSLRFSINNRNSFYTIDYPLVYIGSHMDTPWLKFIDTLTITKAYETADESSCYKLVY